MKKQKFIHTPTFVNKVISSEDRLGRFFALLLRIDQRNNPEFYESNKDRDCADSSAERSHSIRQY
jgi:hypothetical protein